ncbi:MAG TPA: ROK family protein [Blastocatellia bacterium]|nr:ROK family protein [Blastocatellia bacterium]
MRPHILGIDLGGTKVMGAVMDGHGQLVARARAKTRGWRNDEEVFRTIMQVGHRAIEHAGISADQLSAVGICAPGPIDFDTGYIIETANLNFKNFPLGPRTADEFGRPTIIENDVNAGVYGELKGGAAQGARNVLGVFIGTGIGGGLIVNGALYRGSSTGAGEVGHIIIEAGGPRCGCGNRGCLEALASRTAITRDIRKAIKRGKRSSVAKLLARETDLLSGKDLKAAYDSGDEIVKKAVNRAARLAGIGIGSLLNVLGPEIVVLGGGVVEAFGDEFVARIERSARNIAFEINSKNVKFTRAQLGDDAGVIGAATLAREALTKAARHSG